LNIQFTDEALEDLSNIELHGLTEFGGSQTEKYLSQLKRSLELVARNPQMGVERQGTSRSVRIHPSQAHLIIYESAKKQIRVILILHRRQNWQDHL
jgi:toxin ParE1/3/4